MPDFDLKEFRSRMSWSQRECARQLDVAYTSVQRWERDGAPHHIALACHALERLEWLRQPEKPDLRRSA